MPGFYAITRRLLNLSFLPIGLAAMYIVHLLVAKVYSIEDFGKFSTVLAATSLISIIFTAGIPASAQKYLSAYKANADSRSHERYLVFCLYWMTAAFIAVVLISALSSLLLPPTISSTVNLGAIMTLATSAWLWQRYICLGMGKIASALVPRDVVVPICSILILLYAPPARITRLHLYICCNSR